MINQSQQASLTGRSSRDIPSATQLTADICPSSSLHSSHQWTTFSTSSFKRETLFVASSRSYQPTTSKEINKFKAPHQDFQTCRLYTASQRALTNNQCAHQPPRAQDRRTWPLQRSTGTSPRLIEESWRSSTVFNQLSTSSKSVAALSQGT